MTAAVVDVRQAKALVAGLQERADLDPRTGKHYFHTVRANEDRVRAMTEFIAAAPGVRSILTARAPVPARGQEDARQACLGELLARVAREGASTMTMDGRTSLGARPKALNDLDQATVRAARQAGVVPAGFQVRHVDDRDAPLVWIADVVGWQARRAIEYREPERLAPLVGRLAMVEARVLLPAVELNPRRRQEGRVARVHGPSPTLTSSGGRHDSAPVPDPGLPATNVAPAPASANSTGLQAHLNVVAVLAAQARARAEAQRAGDDPVQAPRLRDVVAALDARVNAARAVAGRVRPLAFYVTNPREEQQRAAPQTAAAHRVPRREDDGGRRAGPSAGPRL